MGNEILIALAVVGGVGLLMGVLLALVSHYFGVPDDTREKELRALLPGINCGACGYRGCDDYAKALAAGEAKANLCVPGGESVANDIGEYLGVEVEPVPDLIAYVHCGGDCEHTTKKADYEGISSCAAASALYGGPNDCIFGCLGFGDCAAACPASAICVADGLARVIPDRCIGCTLCNDVCPKELITMRPKSAGTTVLCSNHNKGMNAKRVCANACIACGKCQKVCPHDAIHVIANLATIDYEKCTGCGACVAACPTGCLRTLAHAED